MEVERRSRRLHDSSSSVSGGGFAAYRARIGPPSLPGEPPDIAENPADTRAAQRPVEVQLRIPPPARSIDEAIAVLDEPDTDYLVAVVPDAQPREGSPLRRLATETFCAAAFVVPGRRESGEVLAPVSVGSHARAALVLAHRLAESHDRSLTTLWVEPDIGPDAVRVGRQLEGREPEERMDGGKPQVAAADAHAARRFQVVEEINDQRRVDLLELQIRRLPAETFPRERQELAEGVPVGLDGVRARLALVHQALDEEPLEQGRKAGRASHGRSSQRLSRRRTASRISSGEASR